MPSKEGTDVYRLILILTVVTCAHGLKGDETSTSVDALAIPELQQLLDAYTVSLTSKEVSALNRFAESVKGQEEQKLVDQLLKIKDARVSLETVVDLAKSDSSGFLRNEFAQSEDPLVRFGMNYELAKAGNLVGGEALFALLNDRTMDVQLQRALKTYFGILGIKSDTKDATQILALLSPRDAVNLIGKQAPEFKVETSSGKSVSLSNLRGKVVLLHFWATWCEPCMAQMPELKIELENYPSEKFVSVFVSLDLDKTAFREAIDKLRLPGHQILSANGINGGITRAYSTRSVPFDVVIDESGIVRSYSSRDISKFVR